MAIRVDPEENETQALFDLVDFGGMKVLEIGSGDGRLTWRFAAKAAYVTGIEPFAPNVEKARLSLPQELMGQVEFHPLGFDEFASTASNGSFDCALLSWALC